jgi:hypothetical protein
MNPARNGGPMRGVGPPAIEALRRHLLFEAFWQRLSLGLVGVNGCPPKKRAAPTKPLPSAGSDLVEASPSCVFWDGEGTRFNLSY